MATTANSALRGLPRATLIYGLGDLVPKALYFVLLPWYLRYLPPREFGIVALASTFSTLLGFLLQLNLNGSVFRYYLDQGCEEAQRRFVGTLFVFQLCWAGLVVGAVQLLGPLVINGVRVTSVPFDPYLRLATWLGLVTSLPVLPLAVLQKIGRASCRERV